MHRVLLIAVAVIAASANVAAIALSHETIYRVGGDVKAPVKLSDCEVRFPRFVRGKKIVQPFFIYDLVITKTGRVESIALVEGPHGDPYDAIERTFRKQIKCSRFRPATFHGTPVAVHYKISASADVW
jgi:hypothetical protein